MTKYLFLISHNILPNHFLVLFSFSFLISSYSLGKPFTVFQLLCDLTHAAEYSWRKITTGSCFNFIIANFKWALHDPWQPSFIFLGYSPSSKLFSYSNGYLQLHLGVYWGYQSQTIKTKFHHSAPSKTCFYCNSPISTNGN